MLFLRQGIGFQPDSLQSGIVEQIDGVERAAPGIVGLAADVGISEVSELLECRGLGALVGIAAIRGYLLLVPLGADIALVFQWYPVHHIFEGAT